jgi:hypothetical protein
LPASAILATGLPESRHAGLQPGASAISSLHEYPPDVVYAFLQDDERLYCTEDTPQRAFWTYWGNPAFDIPQGTLCFGDIELLESQTLLITAQSDARMEVLLESVMNFTDYEP